MILMIDNYDSFTYNLYQYIGTVDPNIEVYRNDKITVEDVLSKSPEKIVLSPGPGYPQNAGICLELIKKAENIPILGVCLGHQAIGEAFGGRIIRAEKIMHGKSDKAFLDEKCKIFKGLGNSMTVGRYHSLMIDPYNIPECLKITAKTEDGCIMAVEHKERPIYGIQFHPESVLTPDGIKLLTNFLKL